MMRAICLGLIVFSVLVVGAPPEARLVEQLGGEATALALLDSQALVSQGKYLHVIDLSSPVYAKLLTTLAFRSTVRHLVIRGSTVLAVLDTDGCLVDFSEPATPRIIGYLSGIFATGVITEDLVIAISENSFQVHRFSPSGRPEFLSYVHNPDFWGPKLAAVRGQELLVVDPGGIHVYDLTNPAQPTLRAHGTFKISGTPMGRGLTEALPGALVDDYLYVLLRVGDQRTISREIMVFDIADPEKPRLVAREEVNRAVDIRLEKDGALLVLSKDSKITWFDPNQPLRVLRQFAPPRSVGESKAAATYRDWVCILTAEHGLRLYPKTESLPGPKPTPPSLPPSILSVRHRGSAEPDPAYDVAQVPGWVYVAGGERGLLWCNVSGPEIKRAGEIPVPGGAAYGVRVKDGWLYIGAGLAGMWIADIRNPASPTVRAKLALSGAARSLAFLGNLALVAASHGGVQVVDVTEPLRPRLRSQIPIPGYAWDVDAREGKVFVAAGAGGLHIVDVSNPDEPRALGTLPLPGTAYSVCLLGDHAFVALGFSGLAVVDVAQPTGPKLVAQLHLPGVAVQVRSARGLIWVATEWGGVRILNVDDPLHPREVGYETIPGGGWAKALLVADEYLYIAGTGVHIFRIAAEEKKITTYIPMESGFFFPPGMVEEVVVAKGWLYAFDGAGLTVLSLTDPSHPKVEAFIPHPVWPAAVRGIQALTNEDYLYALSQFGLFVWSLGNPARPQFLTRLPFKGPGHAHQMALAGKHLYISFEQALLVVDVSTPERPFVVHRLPLENFSTDVAVVDGLLLVVQWKPPGIAIYRTVAPDKLLKETFYRIAPYGVVSAVGVGHYAILGSNGIVVLDLSNPQNPRRVSAFNTGSTPTRLVVYDGLLVAVGGVVGRGIMMYDISGLPNIPHPGTMAWAAGDPNSAVIFSDHLYAGFGEGGLAVFRLIPPKG